MEPSRLPVRVLMVCTGNICRSPMAEVLLQAALRGRGVEALVQSAGIAAQVGRHADPTALELMLERGLDLRPHRARQLTADLLGGFDRVVVMEAAQQRLVEAMFPVAQGRVQRLGLGGGFDVPDPYRRGRAAFERALELIDRGLRDLETSLWRAAP